MLLDILGIPSTKGQVTLLRAVGTTDVRLLFLRSASIQWKSQCLFQPADNPRRPWEAVSCKKKNKNHCMIHFIVSFQVVGNVPSDFSANHALKFRDSQSNKNTLFCFCQFLSLWFIFFLTESFVVCTADSKAGVMYHVKSYRDAHDVQSHFTGCSTLLGGGIAWQILCLYHYMYAWTVRIWGFTDAFESAPAWINIIFPLRRAKWTLKGKKPTPKQLKKWFILIFLGWRWCRMNKRQTGKKKKKIIWLKSMILMNVQLWSVILW